MRQRPSSRQGQSIVEFAFVLPLLLLLTFGIIEFGFFVYNKQIITNAAREGARVGIIATQPRVPASGADSITAIVDGYCANHLVTFGNASSPVTTVTGYAPNAAFGSNLSVRVDYSYSFLFFPILLNQSKVSSIEAVAVMRYE